MSEPTMPFSITYMLQQEIDRVRHRVIPTYKQEGDASRLCLTGMDNELSLAETALAERNTPQCLRAYKALRQYRL